jgi:hypothetical protein
MSGDQRRHRPSCGNTALRQQVRDRPGKKERRGKEPSGRCDPVPDIVLPERQCCLSIHALPLGGLEGRAQVVPAGFPQLQKAFGSRNAAFALSFQMVWDE